ncbi:hypothetical protein [Clostridium chrysemydis]|uniref:hypothetical protein n=1 Tax=Clostridium chrysemydis TaxID=2665504 RepID=UPI0018844709|nr:hypothetical protein [Clostridium chrysemydis]
MKKKFFFISIILLLLISFNLISSFKTKSSSNSLGNPILLGWENIKSYNSNLNTLCYKNTIISKNYGYKFVGIDSNTPFITRDSLYIKESHFKINMEISNFSIINSISHYNPAGYDILKTKENYKSSLGLFGDLYEKTEIYDLISPSGAIIGEKRFKKLILDNIEFIPLYKDSNDSIFFESLNKDETISNIINNY